MSIDFNTLLVGFIGSVIGILLTGSFGRITNAFSINRYRKILINYIDIVAIPKCEKYLENMESSIETVRDFSNYAPGGNKEFNKGKLDYMPMFNSDIFKSIPPEKILQTSFNKENHSKIIEITYTIEFLRRNMPFDKMSEFIEKIKNHLDKKQIEYHDIQKHLSTCTYYEKLKFKTEFDFNLKIDCAQELKSELNFIYKKLSGKSVLWILKYIYRQ